MQGDGLWGDRWHLSNHRVQRVLAPSAGGSSEMEYRLSVSLTIGQDERWVLTLSFMRPKEKRLQIKRVFFPLVSYCAVLQLCNKIIPTRNITIAANQISLFSAINFYPHNWLKISPGDLFRIHPHPQENVSKSGWWSMVERWGAQVHGDRLPLVFQLLVIRFLNSTNLCQCASDV